MIVCVCEALAHRAANKLAAKHSSPGSTSRIIESVGAEGRPAPARYPAFATGGAAAAVGQGAGTGKAGIRLAAAGSLRCALPPGMPQARLAKARQCGQSALHAALSPPQAPHTQAGSSAVVELGAQRLQMPARLAPQPRRRLVERFLSGS